MRIERPGRLLAILPIAALAAAVPIALSQPAVAIPSEAPLTWTFDKCAVSYGLWQGTATGPDGTSKPLETQLTELRIAGDDSDVVRPVELWHVDFTWDVEDTYVAELSGTLNTSTGAVVMNGQVVSGSYKGSHVHEEGQLTDPTNYCFSGTITVMPAS